MMKMKKSVTGIEIFLLVSMSIAFSYFVSEVLPEVSAQEEPVIEEQIPDASENDADPALQEALDSGNYESEADLESAVSEASDTGVISPELLNVLRVFNSLIPPMNQLDGGEVLQGLLDQTGGGIYVCPLTSDNEICQNIMAKDCD